MKTIRDHLNELPEPIRSQAIENTSKIVIDEEAELNAGKSLAVAFVWLESPQGYSYWEKIAKEYGWRG